MIIFFSLSFNFYVNSFCSCMRLSFSICCVCNFYLSVYICWVLDKCFLLKTCPIIYQLIFIYWLKIISIFFLNFILYLFAAHFFGVVSSEILWFRNDLLLTMMMIIFNHSILTKCNPHGLLLFLFFVLSNTSVMHSPHHILYLLSIIFDFWWFFDFDLNFLSFCCYCCCFVYLIFFCFCNRSLFLVLFFSHLTRCIQQKPDSMQQLEEK